MDERPGELYTAREGKIVHPTVSPIPRKRSKPWACEVSSAQQPDANRVAPVVLGERRGVAERRGFGGSVMWVRGVSDPVMVFFSNRLGCLGSILVSAIGTLVLLAVLGVVRLH
jgi:hypothetical protein